MAELVKKYEFQVDEFALIPSDGGTFEVKIGDKLIYSKLQTGRHPQDGEVDRALQDYL